MEPSVDILKSKSYDKTSNSAPVSIITPYPCSATTEDEHYYKNYKYI